MKTKVAINTKSRVAFGRDVGSVKVKGTLGTSEFLLGVVTPSSGAFQKFMIRCPLLALDFQLSC